MNAIDNVISRSTITDPSRRGLLWSALGMLGFSFTLTATRAAAPELGGLLVGFGRSVIAGVLAVLVIVALRLQPPSPRQWRALARTALGIVVGFPTLTALALRWVPASHAQVFLGLTPLVTALFAALRGGERLPRSFWAVAGLGAAAVCCFGWLRAEGDLGRADWLLLAAVVLVGFGYAEGGRLAREIGGLRVVCWTLVVALPITLPVCAITLFALGYPSGASRGAWLGFAYVSTISMFLAFIAWYRGLGMGGVARTSQVQLVMPVMGLGWAALLLGEHVELGTLLAAGLVSALAFCGTLLRSRAAAQAAPR